MPVVTFLPQGKAIELEPGKTLLHAARMIGSRGETAVEAPCGGVGICGRCRIHITQGLLPDPTPAEKEALTEEELQKGIRLACQCVPEHDLKVTIPPGSMPQQTALQVDGAPLQVDPDPAIRRFPVQIKEADLEYPISCWRQIEETLQTQHGPASVRTDLSVIQQRQALAVPGPVAAIVHEREVIDLQPADPPAPLLGLAVDFGTTKVAGYLVDLETGETLASQGVMNPQIRFGADVVSRIAFAQTGSESEELIRQAARECINHLGEILAERIGARRTDIVYGVIVANTAMHHLFLGLPVRQLGSSPYMPALVRPLNVKARDLDLEMAPGAVIYFTPPIAGYIGSDHTAMILGSGIHHSDGIVLGLDIGTNTELVLAGRGKLRACSCASGPAFEGANIRHGVRAVDGAVWRVRADGGGWWHCDTIGEKPAVGLCGSGVVDAVAELVKEGLVNHFGILDRTHDRVRINPYTGEPEFLLVDPEKSSLPGGLTIGQKDIGAIQLAKAAISAGTAALLDAAGVGPEQIDRVIVAGAFGTHLDPVTAMAIGLLPDLPLERITQVGNAAGAGARMSLVSETCRREAENLALRVNYLELASHPAFGALYARALRFPEPTA